MSTEKNQLWDDVFGHGWHNLVPGGDGLTGDAPSVIFPILESLNSVILSAVVAIAGWMLIRGAVGTAHEGQPMGRNIHSIWAPIRLAMASCMLAPIPFFKGLCLFQVFVMGAMSLSNGLANDMWEAALDYLVETGGRVTLSVPSDFKQDGQEVAAGLMKAAGSAALIEREKGIALGHSLVVHKSETSNDYILTVSVAGEKTLTAGDLGSVEVPCGELALGACEAKVQAVQDLYSQVLPIARDIVFRDPVSEEAYRSAVEDYQTALSAATAQAFKDSNPEIKQEVMKFRDTALEDGWIVAGLYYWTLARINEKAVESAMPSVVFNPVKHHRLTHLTMGPRTTVPGQGAIHKKIETFVNAAFVDKHIEAATVAAGEQDDNVIWAMFKKWSRTFDTSLVQYYVEKVSDGGDPISNLACLGRYLINWGIGTVGAYWLTSGGESTVWGKVATGVTGVGGFISAAGPYVFILFLSALILGFTMAFYLPSLPMIIWISSILGYLILCVEALVACPLWIAAHAFPEGDGLVHERGKQGYLLMINIALRPALMVVGLVFSLVLVAQCGKWVAQAFMLYYHSQTAHNAFVMPLMTAGAMIVIFTTTMTIFMHKVFKLVTHLPEKVISWVGHGSGSLGEAEDEQRARQIYGAVASRHQSGLAQGMGMSGGKKADKFSGESGGSRIKADLKPGSISAPPEE